MSIAANKIKGIRAVLITSKKTAQQSREHLDSNILCLGANTISFSLAKKLFVLGYPQIFFLKSVTFVA